MRYSNYGLEEVRRLAQRDQDLRATSQALGTMEHGPDEPEAALGLPQGVTPEEAKFLLRVLARLKEKRFGRLEVTVREGRVVSAELIEKIDRNLFRFFSS